MTLPSINTVALAFDRILKRDLTAAEYREVLRRNRTDKYAHGSCASHDFLDANMTMLEAMSECTGMDQDSIVSVMFPEDGAGNVRVISADNSASDPELLTLWNAAWEEWRTITK
jgi:hypothetical protein